MARAEVHPRPPARRRSRTGLGQTHLEHALREVVVTSYDMTNREPYFFKRWRAREAPESDRNRPLVGRRAGHLGRPDLLPLARARRERARRRRRLRREPGDRRDRRGAQADRRRAGSPRPGRPARRLDRHRPARGRLQPGEGPPLGQAGMGAPPARGAADPRRRRSAARRTAPTTGPTPSSTTPPIPTSRPRTSAMGRATSGCRCPLSESVAMDDASRPDADRDPSRRSRRS